MFGKERVQAIIRQHHREASVVIRDRLFEAVERFTEGRQEDDITLAVIKIL
jgi:serine phosphatase RsbU (regulator of sigma subunit)